MSNMDADSKAILESIIATSENPLMDIMANICAGKSSARVPVEAKPSRSRSNSNSSDSSDTGAAFLRFMESISSDSSQSDAGPSSDSKGKDAEDKEEKPESLVDRVKRQKLDQYERPFLDCIVDTDEIASDFDSVCLPEDTVDTLRSLVSLPLLCPEEFQTGILKQHSMSGALLFGPPGTGKTLFAQAIAKESGANMISVKPSDILDKCVGESEKLVRGLFKLARRLHPCVVFIDELDALFGARTHAGQQNSARWHTSMLTEFMQEMDGLMASRVVVIGATNRPFDLDDAVIRRLPCRMLIDLPDQGARQEIMRILLRDEALAEDVNLESLAGKTDNYSGSDLKNLCVAAAVNAVKDNFSVPWKTGSKKGKERAPGQSYARAKPSPSITPVSEPVGASIVEVTEGDDTDSSSNTPKSTSTTTEPSIDASTSPSTPAPEAAKIKPSYVTSRVLENKDFARALTQVGASSSADQTNLNEIRTWNTKFGSGANRMSNILGGGYTGRPSVPPYNPSSAGTGIPGYAARPGGSNMFGSSGAGSGLSGIGSSSGTGIPGYGGASGTGIPGYGASSTGTGISGYGGAGAGSGMSGYPSSTGTGISGINGTGMSAGMGAGMGMGAGIGSGIGAGMGAGIGAGASTGGPRFDHGGAGGGSLGYTGPGASGAGTGIPGYASAGSGMNFGAGALAGGRDMSWLQRPGASSGLGLGSDDMDYSSIAAAARQMGAGSGGGFSSESALGKAIGI